jgi:hypothetical protein
VDRGLEDLGTSFTRDVDQSGYNPSSGPCVQLLRGIRGFSGILGDVPREGRCPHSSASLLVRAWRVWMRPCCPRRATQDSRKWTGRVRRGIASRTRPPPDVPGPDPAHPWPLSSLPAPHLRPARCRRSRPGVTLRRAASLPPSSAKKTKPPQAASRPDVTVPPRVSSAPRGGA